MTSQVYEVAADLRDNEANPAQVYQNNHTAFPAHVLIRLSQPAKRWILKPSITNKVLLTLTNNVTHR